MSFLLEKGLEQTVQTFIFSIYFFVEIFESDDLAHV